MAGLYIHIPFCGSKCAYCDFYSLGKSDRELKKQFVTTLRNEWEQRQGEIEDRFQTVYIGGGTPSLLPPELLSEVIAIGSECTYADEFTIEVNPEDVSDDFARMISDSPVNRVSMGVQSLSDAELSAIGRRHDSATAIKAYEHLRKAGIDNISCDLIFGLPGQSLDSWNRSLSRMLELKPEHLSAYILSYEHGTRLYALRNRGEITEASDTLIESMYDLLLTYTRQGGYEHYEISNYSLPGSKSKHNASYWNYTPYLGLGPGAHSFMNGQRIMNKPNLKEYIAAAGLNSEHEYLTQTEEINERLMLGLRTSDGVAIGNDSVWREIMAAAKEYINKGILIRDNGRLKMNERDWLITDSILVDLFR